MSAVTDSRPRRLDSNLVVIGAGSAGLVTAYVAAAAKARVILIERDHMGGDCLNTGCVPSKALIRCADVAATVRHGQEFGVHADNIHVDFPAVMERVRSVIEQIAPHDSVERYTRLGVECVAGDARILSPWRVAVGDREITTRSIVIATGGQPVVPPIPGLDACDYLTSDTIWGLRELPRGLLILGGGPIGCELAQAFARLGSDVTLVEMAPRILLREDPDASSLLTGQLTSEGIRILTGYKAVRFECNNDHRAAVCEGPDGETVVTFDQMLVATGRRATTEGLGLDNVGIELNPDGTIKVDDYMRTSCPGIYACGDVTGPYQLTHAAGHQGWYCAMNALFSGIKKFRVSYSALPWVVFTDPQLARVGLTESEAIERGLAVETTRYDFADLDRAIAEGNARGFIKIVTRRGSDQVLGATILGPEAGELITEFVTAMRHGLGLRKLLSTIHTYPTLSEAIRGAAGNWQKQHLPGLLLALSKHFHRWRRH